MLCLLEDIGIYGHQSEVPSAYFLVMQIQHGFLSEVLVHIQSERLQFQPMNLEFLPL